MALVAAATGLIIYATVPRAYDLKMVMEALRAAAVASGCPADRVRVAARVAEPDLREIEVRCDGE